MQDRPDARELLSTIGDFLEHELVPELDGPLKYRSRVASNLVRILERELALEPQHGERERERLEALLGASAPPVADLPPAEAVAALNARLAEALRDGSLSEAEEARVWEALMATTREKLAVVRPGHDAYDGTVEAGGGA